MCICVTDDSGKTEIKSVSKDLDANDIRAEPNIEVNVNTNVQDTTESGEKGAQASCKIPPQTLAFYEFVSTFPNGNVHFDYFFQTVMLFSPFLYYYFYNLCFYHSFEVICNGGIVRQ